MNKRNIGIIGSSDSGASDVFEAIKRLDQTPKPDYGNYVLMDGMTEWEVSKPYSSYDAKKRKKPLIK